MIILHNSGGFDHLAVFPDGVFDGQVTKTIDYQNLNQHGDIADFLSESLKEFYAIEDSYHDDKESFVKWHSGFVYSKTIGKNIFLVSVKDRQFTIYVAGKSLFLSEYQMMDLIDAYRKEPER